MSVRGFILLIIFTSLSIFGGTYLLSKAILHNDSGKTIAVNLKPTPQKTKVINVGKTQGPVNLKVTTLPKFVFDLVGDKFQHLWEVDAAERPNLVDAQLSNAKGDVTLDVNTSFDESKKQMTVTPDPKFKVKPGLYNLDVKVKNSNGEDVTLHQDFTWGVLAINTSKGIYVQGEQVQIGMAVLGDYGNTKCIAKGDISLNTAKVWLTVTSPSGKVQNFSTDDGTIQGSGDCRDRSVTNQPDFIASLKARETGTYTLHMIAQHVLGKRSIDSSFEVRAQAPDFDIERSSYPTRIYPKVDYPVAIKVAANKNYKGFVYEVVPKGFVITGISGLGKVSEGDNFKAISWNVDWHDGQTYLLTYTIHFPQISPEFYLVGPLKIGDFSEGREWKIASDSIFQLVQESHAVGSGTSVTTNLPNDPALHDLVIEICYRTTSATFNRPSGWSTGYNNSSGPRIYMYYRVAPAGMVGTITCSTSTSGTIAVQALEFSGNATSSVRDRVNRLNASTVCNSGGFQNKTSNLTPSNPDELVVAAFSATNTTSVKTHSDYTDSAASFNASSGTFDSSWAEVVNNPPVSTHDWATYNQGGGTCDNIQVSFNPTITVSQGSYRFFENADSPNPGSPYAAVNTPLQLTTRSQAFRVRMLLDIDSPSGTTITVGAGDWVLEYAPMPASQNCADGVYNPVGTVADGTPVAFNPNPDSGGNNALISSSGNDPADGGYTTRLEDYIETWLSDGTEDITNNQLSMGNNQAGLFDFSLIDNTDDTSSRTYCFQIANGDQSPVDAYREYPSVTTIHYEVVIRGGTDIRGGTSIL